MNLWCVLGVFGGVVFCPGGGEMAGDLDEFVVCFGWFSRSAVTGDVYSFVR